MTKGEVAFVSFALKIFTGRIQNALPISLSHAQHPHIGWMFEHKAVGIFIFFLLLLFFSAASRLFVCPLFIHLFLCDFFLCLFWFALCVLTFCLNFSLFCQCFPYAESVAFVSFSQNTTSSCAAACWWFPFSFFQRNIFCARHILLKRDAFSNADIVDEWQSTYTINDST